MIKPFNKQISSLLLAIFIDSVGWGVVYPVFALLFINNATHLFPLTTSLALRNFWFELIIAIYCIFMFLASPLLGSLSDRFGRKIILLISLGGNALGFVICALGIAANSLILIIIGRIIAGATAGSLTIAQAALMDISNPSEKALRIGWIGLANGIGFAFGPMLGSFWLNKNLWQVPHSQIAFWFSAALAMVGALFISISFKETFVGNKSEKINLLIGVTHFIDAFKTNTRAYCLMMLFFMLGWNIFFNEIPIFLNERFASTGAQIGYFMSYVALFFALSLIVLLPRALKILSIEKLIFLSLATQLFFQLFFAVSHHSHWIWLIVLPLVLAVPFSYVGIITKTSNLTDKDHQGKIMGVISAIVAFTWGLGPIITGALAKLNFVDPYYASIICLLIAFLLGITQTKGEQITLMENNT